MKKIMIVDDEVLVRIGIKSMVPWEEYGYSIVCDASNGEEAMKKIRQYQPQIVLTDLKMQPMDGFELISKCAEEFPQIKFIVLSNYNDFDNVRKAMKMGAYDYVFKLTIHGDEIRSILDEISVENTEEPEPRKKVDSEEVLLKNREIIKNGLFKQLIRKDGHFWGKIEEDFQDIGLKVDFHQAYCILSIQIDDLDIGKNKGTLLESDLLLFSMGNIIEELMESGCRTEVFQYQDYEFTVVVNRDENQHAEEFRKLLELRFQMVVTYIRQYYELGVSGSVSQEGRGIEFLKAAMEQNAQMLERRFFLESGSLLFYDGTKHSSMEIPESYHVSVFEHALLNGNFSCAGEYLSSVLDYFEGKTNWSPSEIRDYLMQICRRLHIGLAAYGIEVESVLDRNGVKLERAVESYTFYSDIKKAVWEIWEICTSRFQISREKPCRKEITRIKEYIGEHLEQELTVAGCAALCGMSESRFSHVFKEETGSTFVEFVNTARMVRAKELLQNTDLRINEIAERIGILNPNYFSAQYKKKMGLSPNEFRKSLFQQNKKEK